MRLRAGAAALLLSLGALSACGGGTGARSSSAGASPAPMATGVQSQAANAAPTPARPVPGAKPLAGKVIVIDPGHNGGNAAHPEVIDKQVNVLTEHKECDTTGAAAGGYSEHAFTWDVANRLTRILKAGGAKVVLTRANDTGVGPCITERAAIGNRAHADAALSIHADGVGKDDHGFHIIEPELIKGHNDKVVGPSKELGMALRDAYHQATGVPYANYVGTDAINVRDDLGGLNLSTVPKVFIECGNMPNAGDFAKLHDAAFRQRAAQSLAAGLTAYLG